MERWQQIALLAIVIAILVLEILAFAD